MVLLNINNNNYNVLTKEQVSLTERWFQENHALVLWKIILTWNDFFYNNN